jgi:hypothetical protein
MIRGFNLGLELGIIAASCESFVAMINQGAGTEMLASTSSSMKICTVIIQKLKEFAYEVFRHTFIAFCVHDKAEALPFPFLLFLRMSRVQILILIWKE